MRIWSARDAGGRRVRGGGGGPSSAPTTRLRRTAPLRAAPVTEPRATHTAATEAEDVIDLTEGVGWMARIQPDAERAEELAARFRARVSRAEAQRDLQRLRARHWSGERMIEEGRIALEWWEHPEADPYAVLGLLPGAGLDEVAAARRQVAQQHHPDRLIANGEDPDLGVRRMVAANAAYDRIRRAYQLV